MKIKKWLVELNSHTYWNEKKGMVLDAIFIVEASLSHLRQTESGSTCSQTQVHWPTQLSRSLESAMKYSQSQSTRRFQGHTQQERFTVTLNTKYWQSTQSIDSQHNVFTVSAKGICQPVKPASGVSQYYVTMTSATYHWQSTSNLANSRQKSEVIVPKIGQACALRKGVSCSLCVTSLSSETRKSLYFIILFFASLG